MKQKLIILLAALLAAVSAHAFFYTYEDQTLSYLKTSDTTCKVYSYKANASNGDFIIPSTVTYNDVEYNVTEIAENAFKDYNGLTSLVIPETVTSIGESAFLACKSLESVTIPNAVTSIGPWAFAYSGIRHVDLPDGLSIIDNGTFYKCSNLTSITIPNSLTAIYWAFEGCNSLKSVNIPEGVTYIAADAFRGCTSLETVTLPGSIEIIGTAAFAGCPSLKAFFGGNVSEDNRCVIQSGCLKAFAGSGIISYDIPETVTSIDSYAFSGCKDLISICVPDGINTIGKYAFAGCSSLTSFAIPDGVDLISTGTFSGCGRLITINIPESVSSIGNSAFSSCNSLTSIIIPESVTSIGQEAFYDCSNLSKISLPELIRAIEYNTFNGCSSLKSIEIPVGVTSIGNNAFAQCSSLESVIIPDGVISIGNGTFIGCNLDSIILPASIAKIGYQAFCGCNKLTKVFIPETQISIGFNAFRDCNSLAFIYVDNPDPTEYILESDIFDGVDTDHCYLFVPKGSEDLYAEADQWKDFMKINYRVLNDGKPYQAEEDAEEPNVDYIRKFGNTKWQALYLPFAMSYDEWSPYADVAELYNIRGYDTDDDGTIDEVRVEFNRLKEGSSIKPNVPYVIKAKETGKVTFECKDKVVLAAPEEDGVVECSSTKFTYALHGIYEEKTDVFDTGVYFLSGGNFVQAADETVKLAPYRAYLTITQKKGGYNDDSTPVPAPKRVILIVDGEEETTGIDDIQITAPQDDIYYDLTGRRVTNPTSGIYIQNGRKVYIK